MPPTPSITEFTTERATALPTPKANPSFTTAKKFPPVAGGGGGAGGRGEALVVGSVGLLRGTNFLVNVRANKTKLPRIGFLPSFFSFTFLSFSYFF